MDVGRMCVYSIGQPYACTVHGVTATYLDVSSCLWVCWVHVSRAA